MVSVLLRQEEEEELLDIYRTTLFSFCMLLQSIGPSMIDKNTT